MDDPAIRTQTAVPFVDTNIIPDRNAGIGSLLWDLQDSQDSKQDGLPLLGPDFAFIDVGASRARASTTLKTLLARGLGMDVAYVATELPEVVPSANVTLTGDRAEKIRGYLSAMISSTGTTREVTDWHYVVDRKGQVSSVAYSYHHHGNEVWEAYFMGRHFMVSGESVEFLDPTLEAMLAPDVATIEAGIVLERARDSDPSQPAPSWDGYRVEREPLKSGLAEFGITLQTTDVPQRIKDRQNVLFLGNVLNHYPPEERVRELDRITAHMREGDLVVVQVDEVETSFIEVLHVKGLGSQRTRERVRWINTKTLELQRPVGGPGAWRQMCLRPELDRMAGRLIDCLGRRMSSPEWSHAAHTALVHRYVSQVFRAYFRALPVKETFHIAIREVLRRLPSEAVSRGIPVFKDDARDAYGDALGSERSPIVSEADLIDFGLSNSERRPTGDWTADVRARDWC